MLRLFASFPQVKRIYFGGLFFIPNHIDVSYDLMSVIQVLMTLAMSVL